MRSNPSRRQAVAALLSGLFTTAATAFSPPPPDIVAAIDTIGSDSAGFALAPGPVLAPVTGLRLQFEYPVALEAHQLQLVEAGPDGRLDTTRCDVSPYGDDVRVALRALRPGVPASEVAADFGPATGLPAGDYRFLFCEQISYPTQRRDFSIGGTSQLANPNFSTGTAGWQAVALGGADTQLSYSSLDADGSSVSGAVRVQGAAGSALLLYSESCAHDVNLVHRLHMKHRVLQGEVRIRMVVIAGFAGDQDDGPCVGPVMQQFTLQAESGPAAGYVVMDSGRLPPIQAPAARFAVQVQNLGDTPFDVLLDDVGFVTLPDAVFFSRFD
jgi:hypothetical protein